MKPIPKYLKQVGMLITLTLNGNIHFIFKNPRETMKFVYFGDFESVC